MHTAPFKPHDLAAILFDLDGTLIDTDNVDVARWERRLARLYGQPGARAGARARQFVMALETPVNAAFTLLDLVGLDTPIIRLMVALQGSDQPDQLPAVSSTPSLIQALAGCYKIGIVTTRTVAQARAFASAQGFHDNISVIAGRDSTWRIKPHPQPVQYAAHALGISTQQCLMVGDTTVDIKAGRRAGAWTCGVLCGYGYRAELERAGAHIILDHTSQLASLL